MLVLDRPTVGDLLKWLRSKGLQPIPISDSKPQGIHRQWVVANSNHPHRRTVILDDGKRLRSFEVDAYLEPLDLDPDEFWAAHMGPFSGPVAPRDDPEDEYGDDDDGEGQADLFGGPKD